MMPAVRSKFFYNLLQSWKQKHISMYIKRTTYSSPGRSSWRPQRCLKNTVPAVRVPDAAETACYFSGADVDGDKR